MKKIIKLLPLSIIAFIGLFFFLKYGVGGFLQRIRTPLKLTKQDIIGEYKIDTTFYRGNNARWQYAHYYFSINQSDSLQLSVLDKTGKTAQIYKHKINYSAGPPDLWSIADTGSVYHVIKNKPTLYRSHDRFYYVLHSEKFGNMFFRKINP